MKPKKLSIVIFPITLVLIGFLVFGRPQKQSNINISNHAKHRGVCWVASHYKPDSLAFQQLVNNNVNWICHGSWSPVRPGGAAHPWRMAPGRLAPGRGCYTPR